MKPEFTTVPESERPHNLLDLTTQIGPGSSSYSEISSKPLVKSSQLTRLTGQKFKLRRFDGDYVLIDEKGCRHAVEGFYENSPAIFISRAAILITSRFGHLDNHKEFIASLILLLIYEYTQRIHSQKSLDESMNDIEKLVPCKDDWVDARALHRFLGESDSMENWYKNIHATLESYCLFQDPTKDRIPPLAVSRNNTTYLKSGVAYRVILSSSTSRGSLLRQDIRELESLLHTSFRNNWGWEIMGFTNQQPES